MSVFDYPIGSPFHYEMEMKSGDEVDALAKLLNDGKPDIITMDGRVLYNDGTRAVIVIDSRFEEFAFWMLSFKQVCKLSPKFQDIFGGMPGWQNNEYVCIDVESGEFVYPNV